jgi:hypothetical protein
MGILWIKQKIKHQHVSCVSVGAFFQKPNDKLLFWRLANRICGNNEEDCFLFLLIGFPSVDGVIFYMKKVRVWSLQSRKFIPFSNFRFFFILTGLWEWGKAHLEMINTALQFSVFSYSFFLSPWQFMINENARYMDI